MSQYYYKVALHCLQVNLPDHLQPDNIIPSFSPFKCEEEGIVLLSMDVRTGEALDVSGLDEIGLFDCGGAIHGVYQLDAGGYLFSISLPGENAPLACQMISNSDFSQCEAVLTGEGLHSHRFGLNNALMMAYAFAAATADTLLIHASVIRHAGYGYLFTAPSGTGKSTHTHLWYKHIPGCDLMNDDNPVVRIVDGETRIYGSPWSGKTPCYRNIWAPVGAITRIEQKPENNVRRMQAIEAFATLLPAVSSMKWDRRVYVGICDTISKLLRTTPVFWLGCRPDEEAARVCFNAVAVCRD
ncbi:MAG: hypothetical protein IJ209_04740 [Bacteroidaceae bacterium]|nr:hypothetical protein [Bacteroidaceae bacterium]